MIKINRQRNINCDDCLYLMFVRKEKTMKKIVTVFLVFCLFATLSFAIFAESATVPVDDCDIGGTLSATLRVSSAASASSSCYNHMTSVFLYATNSTTGESDQYPYHGSPSEAMNSVSAYVELSIPPTYASSTHGAWCIGNSNDNNDGYVGTSLTSNGVDRSVGN